MTDPTPLFPLEAYDTLAEMARRPGAPQSDVAPLAALVSADLKRRGRWFEDGEDAEGGAKPEAFGRGVLVFAGLVAWLAVLLGVTLVVGWIMALAFVGVSVPALLLELHRRKSERARRARATGLVCPKCAYDLAGLGDDLPREWVVGSSGPRRCPECGAPWPMVLREVWGS